MLLLRSTSRVTAATATVWGAFAMTVGLRASGAALSPRVAASIAAVAAALALACAARAVCSIWRGPRVVSFAFEEAVLCPPAVSDVIRCAAQLRGTMGGAGHVHRGRRLIPAIAWGAAAVIGATAVLDPEASLAGWPLVVAVLGMVATTLFPARPFYYREVNGGGVLVSPRSAPHRLGVSGESLPVDSGVLGFG